MEIFEINENDVCIRMEYYYHYKNETDKKTSIYFVCMYIKWCLTLSLLSRLRKHQGQLRKCQVVYACIYIEREEKNKRAHLRSFISC